MGILTLASFALIALGAIMAFRSTYVGTVHGFQCHSRAQFVVPLAVIAIGMTGVAFVMSQDGYFHS